jgi:hypothetical protein
MRISRIINHLNQVEFPNSRTILSSHRVIFPDPAFWYHQPIASSSCRGARVPAYIMQTRLYRCMLHGGGQMLTMDEQREQPTAASARSSSAFRAVAAAD